MAAILNSAILNCAILDSAILVYPLKLTHTCQDWIPPIAQRKLHSFILTQLDDGSQLKFVHPRFNHFAQKNSSLIHSDSTLWWQPSWILPCWIQPFCTKKIFTHSFWLNLMMAAILNSAMLDSDTAILDSNTLLSSLRFTQKHSHSTQTLTQTNSIWLTWWWQPSWILPSWIQPFLPQKKTSLIHSDSISWWQPSWFLPCWIQTLPSWIQTPCYLLSDLLKNTLTPFWLWLKLIQFDSNSFILTQLDDGSHLEFCHLWFSHFAQKKFHSFLLTQLDDGSHLDFFHLGFSHFAQKRTSLIHSDSTLWWQPSWTLPCWIQTPCYLLSYSLKNTLTPFWLWLKLINLINLKMATILNSVSLEFFYLGFSHFAQNSDSN